MVSPSSLDDMLSFSSICDMLFLDKEAEGPPLQTCSSWEGRQRGAPIQNEGKESEEGAGPEGGRPHALFVRDENKRNRERQTQRERERERERLSDTA